MAVAGRGGGEEVEQRVVDDENLVAEMYKYGGAFSLVGLEFDFRAREDAPALRIKLDGLLKDGETYRATDVRADKPLEDAFHPKELMVERASRGRRDPVILLMRRLNMNPEAYLDPLAARSGSGLGDYLTPETQIGQRAERRRASMPPLHGEHERGLQGGNRFDLGGRGRSFIPMQRPATTPSPQRMATPYSPPIGHAYQQGFRPVPTAAYGPRMQAGAGYAGPYHPEEYEEECMQGPIRELRREGYDRFGGDPSPHLFRQPHPQERPGRGSLEAVWTRIGAMEESRQIERERGAMSSELRRMQSSVSPFEHPGIYAHIDEMVTMHELPKTWAGPLQVAGASGNVLIADNVKLAFLKDAIWGFTRRKCAEAGEVLSEKQIRDIEAQTLEFYGRQRVEAKKILEKARINPNKGPK
jgi:hypothetical protein